MIVGGLVANAQWIQHMTVASTLPTLRVYYILRAMGGGTIVIGAYVFAVNIFMTYLSKPSEKPVTTKLITLEATQE